MLPLRITASIFRLRSPEAGQMRCLAGGTARGRLVPPGRAALGANPKPETQGPRGLRYRPALRDTALAPPAKSGERGFYTGRPPWGLR